MRSQRTISWWGLFLLLLCGCRKSEPAPRSEPAEERASTTNKDAEATVPIMSDNQPPVYGKSLLRAMAATKPRAAAGPGRTVSVPRPWGRSDLRLVLDLTPQLLRLDVPEDRGFGGGQGSAEPELSRSFADLGVTSEGFLGAAVLAHKAKQFDDGLYAAVELAAQDGLGAFVGKRVLLGWLAAALGHDVVPESIMGPATVVASAALGGLEVDAAPLVREAAERVRQRFLAEPNRSLPLSFYSWSPQLVRIFQQDRLLQISLGPPEALSVARALASDAKLLASYGAVLGLAERLTNPAMRSDLRPAAAALAAQRNPELAPATSVLPPSRSHEAELINQLYGERPIPDGFELADELVTRIRSGQLSLAPKASSGWYDHQTWALEPLVVPERTPEASRLQLDESYRKELVGLFKALLALTRETHVRQLESPSAGGMPAAEVRPELPIEPLATYYLRRARSYSFVRGVLVQAFGEAGLGRLRRQTPGGPMNLSLKVELKLMERLFHGAYLAVCEELAMRPQADAGVGGPADLDLLRVWARAVGEDPDMGRDMRMMVPVFYDVGRRKMKVWAVLGLATKALRVSFAAPPVIRGAVDGRGNKTEVPQVEWGSAELRLPYWITAELYVTRVLDRSEFRALCDRHKTAKAILGALN